MGGGSYMVHTVIRYWESIKKIRCIFPDLKGLRNNRPFCFSQCLGKFGIIMVNR